MIDVNCKSCGVKFKTHACWIKRGRGKFCSKFCRSKFGYTNNPNAINIGRAIAKDKGVKFGRPTKQHEIKCHQCSKNFIHHTCDTNRKYCSISCYNKTRPNMVRKKGYKILKATGENHYNWKGGEISEIKRLRDSPAYKEWRLSVFRRDHYTCQECGAKNKKGENYIFHADHIKSFAIYPDLRFDINNGRTLCIDCHKKTPTWGRNVIKCKDKPDEQVQLSFKDND